MATIYWTPSLPLSPLKPYPHTSSLKPKFSGSLTLMEFRYRAGDVRDYSSATGYFAEQALRAGIGIGSSGFAPPAMTSRAEALMEELRRERMREEILTREIAHNRVMEEEIRRELEFEEQMAMRRFGGEERLLPFEIESRVGMGMGERLGPGFMPEREGSLSRGREKVRDLDVWEFERPPVPRKSEVGKAKLMELLSKTGSSSSWNNNLSNHQVSGFKRKAASELPQPTKKEWTCSLCKVAATSQKNLNKHLQGKKHIANAAQLPNRKSRSKKFSTFLMKKKRNADLKKGNADLPLNREDSISVEKAAKKMNTEGKKKQHNGPKVLRCDMCRVQCNTPAMLDCHLKGKKHMAQLNFKKGDDGVGAGATEVVKEVTVQQKREKEAKEEGNAEATNLKKVKTEFKAEDDAEENGEEAFPK